MLAVNTLAVILPIGGVGTDEVSDAYPQPFRAPCAHIRCLGRDIYRFGALYAVSVRSFPQIRGYHGRRACQKGEHAFAASSLFNIAWIFTWHYKVIWASLIFITGILISLMLMALEFKKHSLSFNEEMFMRMPFSLYFGWITITLIANVVTFLVSVNWGGFGMPESLWMIIVLVLGTVISGAAIISYKDFVYGLVIIWAYSGILIKHMSANGFDGNYTNIIITCVICLAILVPLDALTFIHKIEKQQI